MLTKPTKRTRLSFREFLTTGRLGPISPFTTMAEVAKLFGVPDQWAISGDAVVPTYWWYGPVEMQFDPTPPHEMEWFQIEGYRIQTRRTRVAENFFLSTDGLADRPSISTLLRSGIWNPAESTFLFGSFGEGSLSIAVHFNTVQVIFEIHDTAERELLSNLGAPRYLAETALCRIIADFDRYAQINSVYSYRRPPGTRGLPQTDYKTLTGQQYLDLLEQK